MLLAASLAIHFTITRFARDAFMNISLLDIFLDVVDVSALLGRILIFL
jgi:hypothetical protein